LRQNIGSLPFWEGAQGLHSKPAPVSSRNFLGVGETEKLGRLKF